MVTKDDKDGIIDLLKKALEDIVRLSKETSSVDFDYDSPDAMTIDQIHTIAYNALCDVSF